ncbi:WhiB family transcriptional regulator [Nonomuraea rubra]|uniref:Transcriptional regulator WhiB n=1 Tax=Nonomuraea rubra TaxID=46180 RepID=A0A7X0U1W6_9ACTN|nr:WhiB family transcriptional regulator [Nonomuraea rubra]MBB6551820.1 WhiB family redox-sensing transcriptional regulator [Nonomuraea rubra]
MADLYWTSRAACRATDPDLFFPLTWDGRHQPAMRICSNCAVRPRCLEWALEAGEPDGVWGGTTPAERRRLRQHQG